MSEPKWLRKDGQIPITSVSLGFKWRQEFSGNMQELPSKLDKSDSQIPGGTSDYQSRMTLESRKTSQERGALEIAPRNMDTTTRGRPLGTRAPSTLMEGATYFKWQGMAVVTLQGKSDIPCRPGLSPGLSSVVTWLGQVPLRWRGAEACYDLAGQHQPRPVPSEYGLGHKACEFANCN